MSFWDIINYDISKDILEFFLIYGFGGSILLAFVLLCEMLFRWQEGKPVWSREAWANTSLFATMGPFIEPLVFNVILVAALTWVQGFSSLRVPVTLWSLPIYFLVAEFAYYWYHRLGHEVRLFWADHSIHHSAETFDSTVNLRFVPFQFLYRIPIWAPLVLLGFNPLVLVIFTINIPAFQTFCHTQRIGRLSPWFEWLFVTPQNHAVHHASNEPYLDKNYGALTMIWDHAFGTYQKMDPAIPPTYGITHPVNSANPLKILAHEFRPLFNDFRHAPGWGAKLKVLFGKPGQTFEMPRGPAAGATLQPAE